MSDCNNEIFGTGLEIFPPATRSRSAPFEPVRIRIGALDCSRREDDWHRRAAGCLLQLENVDC